MLGCYDFCSHYDWTFRWLEENSGDAMVHTYWEEAICGESQKHAAALIAEKGLEGMNAYWGHTLADEAPDGGYSTKVVGDRFLLEMTNCPSRGFLLQNQVGFFKDYCDHCIGWIGPMMEKAGYTINHAHNHLGQCYWEFRPKTQSGGANPEIEAWKNSLLENWKNAPSPIDAFYEANSARQKTTQTDQSSKNKPN